MASFEEVEKLALALSEQDRARLATTLVESLPQNVTRDPTEPIKFVSVRSSMLRKVGYDAERRLLDVVFKNGDIYRYYNVSAANFEGLMKAKSHGRYMQDHIIDRYDVEKIKG